MAEERFELAPAPSSDPFELVPPLEPGGQSPLEVPTGREALEPFRALTAPGAAKISAEAIAAERQRIAERAAAVTATAKSQGLPFVFESIERQPDFGQGRAFRIARQQNFADIQKEFKKFFPNGEVRQIPDPQDDDKSILVARTTSDTAEPFRLLKERGLGQVTAAVASEQTAGGIVGGVLGGAVGRPFLGMAIGTGAGVVGREVIEPTGRTRADTMIDAATEGAFAGVFGKGASAVFKLLRAGQGQGFAAFFKLRPGAQEMVDAAARLNLPPLMFGQLAQSPLIRGMLAQTAVVSARLETQTAAQTQAVFKNLDDLIAKMGGFAGLSDESIELVVLAQRRTLAQLESRVFKTGKPVSPEDARILKTITDTHGRAISSLRNRRFAAARSAPGSEDIRFATEGISKAVDKLRTGVPGRDAAGRIIPRLGGDVPDTPSGILLKDTLGKLDSMIRVKGLDKTLRMVETFTQGGKKVFAFDQMIATRTALRKVISDPDSGLTPTMRLDVIRLDRAIGRSLHRPHNVGSREARQKLVDALAVARYEGTTVQRGLIVRDLARDDVSKVSRRVLLSGAEGEELRFIRRVASPAQFNKFKDFIKLDLINDPANINARLAAFNAATPRTTPGAFAPRFKLFNNSEVQAMRALGKAQQRAQTNKVIKMLGSDKTEGERALKAATQEGGLGVTEAVRLAGGRLSALGRSIKAGIFQKLLNRATNPKSLPGAPEINPNALLRAIQNVQQTVQLKYPGLFSEADWTRLADTRLYTIGLSVTADIGGGMMGGAIRANIGRALITGGLVGGVGAGRTTFSQAMIARILTSPVHAGRLARFAGQPLTPIKLFVTAGIIKSIQRQIENDAASRGVTEE